MWFSTVPLEMKIKLLQASVLSVLLYGSQTWVLNEASKQTLNGFLTSCLRIILGIEREDRVENDEIYALTNLQPLSHSVQERQLAFLGHSVRRPEDHLANKYALYAAKHGRRGRGAPRTLYQQYISKILQPNFNISDQEIRRAAQDRRAWKEECVAACRRQPNR